MLPEQVAVLVLDEPDADWIRVPARLVCTELARPAGEWFTDGNAAFDPGTDSLLSVDVEEDAIETTVIGLPELRARLLELGPEPLLIR